MVVKLFCESILSGIVDSGAEYPLTKISSPLPYEVLLIERVGGINKFETVVDVLSFTIIGIVTRTERNPLVSSAATEKTFTPEVIFESFKTNKALESALISVASIPFTNKLTFAFE